MSETEELIRLWKLHEDGFNDDFSEAQWEHFADDFVYCGLGAFIDGLTEMKASQEALKWMFEKANFATNDVKGRVHGDTGIVWGSYDVTLTPQEGEAATHSGLFTSTWARVKGRWTNVLNHYTVT